MQTACKISLFCTLLNKKSEKEGCKNIERDSAFNIPLARKPVAPVIKMVLS